jgi:1-phosphofructokinase family hexose kinase
MTSVAIGGTSGGGERARSRLVAVSLSPSIDVTYVVDSFEIGEIHRTEQVHRVPGGKGFNVARAAHALGADVVATGVLGGDTGAWMVQALARTGMRIRPVAGNQPTRTCVAVADAATGTLTEVYEPAPRIEPRAWGTLVATVGELSREHASWVSLSGSLPPGPVPQALADLVRVAQDGGAKVAVDTHSTALAAAVGAGPDLIKVNVREAASVLYGPDHPLEPHPLDPLALAQGLLTRSPRTDLAVVTAGAQGAVALNRAGRVLRAQLDVVGPYPVGSGDSFLGGLLCALTSHPDDLDAALTLATAAGAANALMPGAGRLDLECLPELTKTVVLTSG